MHTASEAKQASQVDVAETPAAAGSVAPPADALSAGDDAVESALLQ